MEEVGRSHVVGLGSAMDVLVNSRRQPSIARAGSFALLAISSHALRTALGGKVSGGQTGIECG